MRAGQRLRPWTSAEERRLREMAGRVPRRRIAWELKRGNEAVRQKAKRMGLSLRCWEPRCAETCPRCGAARSRIRPCGACRPCELRDLIARAEAETADVLAKLPHGARAVYLRTEGRLQSAPPPRPPEPRCEGMSAYRAAKARDEWLLELEAWEVKRLTRQLKAKRRRLERMREKLPNSENE